jgi:hypothetical protein
MAKQITVQVLVPERLFKELQALAQRDLTSLSGVSRKAIALGLDAMNSGRPSDESSRAPGGSR